jgi:hypothetical protein
MTANSQPQYQTAEVLQAQGMVSVQGECGMNQALAIMHDRAAVEGKSLQGIAAGVLDRSIRFGE